MAKRSVTPWHTDRWFTSPWNFLPEVTAGFAPPKSVKIHDVTLRDGEQQAGVVLRVEEKVRIAEALAEAGVHRIEAGLPAVSPADEAAVRAIVKLGLPAEIYAFSRCMTDDVRRAVDCGVAGVVMEVPSSRHLIEKGYRWPVEKAIDLSIEATRFAHEQGLKVSFFPIDATRADMVELLDLLGRVAGEGHADAIVLVDTFGVISPHAVRFFAKNVREHLGVALEAHFHTDFGMGVANTVAAVMEGAGVLHTTVAGIGERAGNTPMEETLLALLTMYGIDTGIRTERFVELSRLVLGLTGVQQAPNRPVIGEQLFNVESGIITSWVKNCSEDLVEAFPFHPGLVGQPLPEIVLGKGSGLDSVAIWLGRHGLTADAGQLNEILKAVKAKSLEIKGLLSDEEFMKIVEKSL
ncbi:MAG: pyruvate carboxyltransferase [Actinomycetota bacterium]